jgi:REP element-mobilizing transposase RayT
MSEGYNKRPNFTAFYNCHHCRLIDVLPDKLIDVIIESLDYCIQNKGMILFGYVIMSNHIHMIIQSQEATYLT